MSALEQTASQLHHTSRVLAWLGDQLDRDDPLLSDTSYLGAVRGFEATQRAVHTLGSIPGLEGRILIATRESVSVIVQQFQSLLAGWSIQNTAVQRAASELSRILHEGSEYRMARDLQATSPGLRLLTGVASEFTVPVNGSRVLGLLGLQKPNDMIVVLGSQDYLAARGRAAFVDHGLRIWQELQDTDPLAHLDVGEDQPASHEQLFDRFVRDQAYHAAVLGFRHYPHRVTLDIVINAAGRGIVYEDLIHYLEVVVQDERYMGLIAGVRIITVFHDPKGSHLVTAGHANQFGDVFYVSPRLQTGVLPLNQRRRLQSIDGRELDSLKPLSEDALTSFYQEQHVVHESLGVLEIVHVMQATQGEHVYLATQELERFGDARDNFGFALSPRISRPVIVRGEELSPTYMPQAGDLVDYKTGFEDFDGMRRSVRLFETVRVKEFHPRLAGFSDKDLGAVTVTHRKGRTSRLSLLQDRVSFVTPSRVLYAPGDKVVYRNDGFVLPSESGVPQNGHVGRVKRVFPTPEKGQDEQLDEILDGSYTHEGFEQPFYDVSFTEPTMIGSHLVPQQFLQSFMMGML